MSQGFQDVKQQINSTIENFVTEIVAFRRKYSTRKQKN